MGTGHLGGCIALQFASPAPKMCGDICPQFLSCILKLCRGEINSSLRSTPVRGLPHSIFTICTYSLLAGQNSQIHDLSDRHPPHSPISLLRPTPPPPLPPFQSQVPEACDGRL